MKGGVLWITLACIIRLAGSHNRTRNSSFASVPEQGSGKPRYPSFTETKAGSEIFKRWFSPETPEPEPERYGPNSDLDLNRRHNLYPPNERRRRPNPTPESEPNPKPETAFILPWPTADAILLESSGKPYHQQRFNPYPWWKKQLQLGDDPWLTESERQNERRFSGDADSCVNLALQGNCDFYYCFDERHTCPDHQNYAMNVGLHFCERGKQHVNNFDETGQQYIRRVNSCQMRALVPTYEIIGPTCSQVETVGFDVLTGNLLPPATDDLNCFFQKGMFCKVVRDTHNCQTLFDLYKGEGYSEYRIFTHFSKLIHNCDPDARQSFSTNYAKKFPRGAPPDLYDYYGPQY